MHYCEWTTLQESRSGVPPAGVPDDLCELTLGEAAALIRHRMITSRQLVEACLHRVSSNTHLNAFISVDAAAALHSADAYDRYLMGGGEPLALGGVPIAVKDNIQVIGFANTAGTRALGDFLPKTHAAVVEPLLAAGAIVLGKNNMHELAFGTSGYNTAFHSPGVIGVRNAFDPRRIAGGSSSGGGSSVGARLVPAALGTDTGGSVRHPAALNGCVGFRPTVGRYSRQGIVPLSPTRDTPGPITRSVDDVILIDSILTGTQPAPPPAAETLRLGLLKEFWGDVSEPVLQVARAALEKLQLSGVELVWVSLPEIFTLNHAISMPVVLHECRAALSEYLQENGSGVTFDALVAGISSPDVRAIFERYIVPGQLGERDGNPIDLEQAYVQAMQHLRPQLIDKLTALFAAHRLHALVHPTTPDLALTSEPQATSFDAFARMIRNADPASNAGMPGISLPAGLAPDEGLPVGLEFEGLPGSDSQLLALAAVMQGILGRAPSPVHFVGPATE
ncbi:Mandelamide hydrolase [Pseudomonas reidholzensis]|uniref:Mandelamide hydrolase n=1 Tax=Pseudomonas reidholzensis TaxID=1785162 RepID=A0A383RY73_9PSED|nr:indoleacetamide hydrolase [Pseudomonas reidholzensis]SYX91845.1 Mandelamide hydrolase [Pseudomonas reidholzensis]